jgi:hypothetical protein
MKLNKHNLSETAHSVAALFEAPPKPDFAPAVASDVEVHLDEIAISPYEMTPLEPPRKPVSTIQR